ncbi:DgyrCDS1615 [Dimorphilus gyrociliatus]|uniref:Tryptophan--tRNA ligase, mitochondrial n=1 Tax=Dimorphilus gyrociliatus TaxID=2664684 RepID=A0A7I8VAQ6_9ANNE|nr:DgyrCDS1615 [Dimorphilus gyrociliatus]
MAVTGVRVPIAFSTIFNKLRLDPYKICMRKNHKNSFQKRIFSGIQPTSIPHVGNYFGAVKSWVDLQNDQKENIILSIVDLHSITVPQNPARLQQQIEESLICLIASGIDPNRTVLFQQSKVNGHASLSWILGCLCTIPQLEHLPQWKEKSELVKESRLGIFTYPVLQAADILLYKATHVPVGEDQVKHIELTRHLAKAFNRTYLNIFPSPQTILGKHKRIKSLRNPANKMSKSEADSKGKIDICDSAEEIVQKVKKAVTDSNSAITYDPIERPGISNLIEIMSAVTDTEPNRIVENSAGLDTVQFKSRVSEAVVEYFRPIRKRFIELREDRSYLHKVLKDGEEKAQKIADETMHEVRNAVGLNVY